MSTQSLNELMELIDKFIRERNWTQYHTPKNLAMSIAIAHMMIQSNMIILSQEHTLMELMALSLGAMGIYLLVLSILLIPLSLATWFLTRIIRNLKERKDPLLSLEGSCDL